MRLADINNVAVVGVGGVMGPGIALGFALAGYQVAGVDIDSAALDMAKDKLSSLLEQMQQHSGLGQSEAKEAKSRITFSLSLEDSVVAVDYVTEAVPEIMEIKQDIFRRCGELCGRDVVVASNTSSMDINQITSEMRFPERALVTHWTIPAPLSPLVEVVRGDKTSEEAYALTMGLLRQAGRVPVPCSNTPGFIHNYLQFSLVKAALDLVESGAATAEDVDAVVKNGFGLRLASVGPIRFVDMCGLDTILNIQKYMYQETQNPVFEPSIMIQEKVEQGDLGIKSGKGFFSYQGETIESFWEQVSRNMMAAMKATKSDSMPE